MWHEHNRKNNLRLFIFILNSNSVETLLGKKTEKNASLEAEFTDVCYIYRQAPKKSQTSEYWRAPTQQDECTIVSRQQRAAEGRVSPFLSAVKFRCGKTKCVLPIKWYNLPWRKWPTPFTSNSMKLFKITSSRLPQTPNLQQRVCLQSVLHLSAFSSACYCPVHLLRSIWGGGGEWLSKDRTTWPLPTRTWY